MSMESNTFVAPVDLRKKPLPAVTVFGDTRAKELCKLLFSLIPGQDVRFAMPETKEALIEEVYHSAIVFVLVADATDDNIELARELSMMPGVVADIIAITPEQEIRRRLHMLTYNYDNIFNWEILGTEDFRHIFLHKLKKGIMRLNARIQEDEYRSFKGYLSVSPDAFIVFDKNKRVLFVSEHYNKVYPRSAHLFVRGAPVHIIFEAAAQESGLRPEEARYQEAKKFWSSLQGQFEFHISNNRVLRISAAPMPGGEGTIVTTTDITLYKMQEKALADKQVELEAALANEQEASTLQKQFISMVSHEFRTPLSIVDGNAQILQRRVETIEPAETQKRLKTIRSAVSRLVNMMEAVLSSNMLKTGKLDLQPVDFNLARLIEEMCQEQADLSAQHKIVCDMKGLPELVYLDPKIMTLILTNLLSNAVKFSVINPVVEVTGTQDAKGIKLSITDNGVGIPQDELTLVFSRFYRATTSSGIPGSGVGLALVRDLILLHGGTIHVESTVGKGTRFDVFFPTDTSTANPVREHLAS